MKIINIGILAHVDAGKTTLTESLLYTSGAIAEQGNVDKGTTRTDTMILERQRGITIQTAVTSFCWNDYKINIVDTPGHMDFLTEAYRSLSVLDGAVLVISAKDGVQAQTRILFHALQKMDIPTIIFINKIDQNGIDLRRVYQSIKDKLTSDMIVMQEVSLSPKITMTDISDLDKWDMIISGSDELLERYVAEDSLDIQELQYEKCKRTRCCSLFPVYHGSAKDNLGTEKLIEAITEMCIPSNGEIVPVDHACPGEIVILADDTLKLNDILGNEKLLPHKTRIDNPMPLLRTTVEPQKPEQREALLNALTEIADTDPLLHFDIDTVTHEIILSFLGKVQLEVICSLLEEKYHVGVAMKEPSVIYLERPQKKASYTIHIEVPPNPFWASIGLTVTPLPVGSGTQYKSEVSLGYLNQSFQNAVMEGVRYGMEQGLYGWGVTDCQICFDYGVYYSPVSTPADFRFLAPVVLEQALKKAGTQLLEPYLSFTLFAPQEYLSRAYNDAPKYCAIIESTRLEKDEVIFKGEIPARCIGEYRNDLNFYTNGRSVCITELKGYQETSGEPVFQPRRPNSRLDKIRHMFQKIM